MRMNELQRPVSVRVRGLFTPAIPYVERVASGDWSQYITDDSYEPQKWGFWDSSCCWCISTVKNIQIQMEYLKANNAFSEAALAFFADNGFFAPDGHFALSERFPEIKGGNRDNGGTAEEACQLIQDWGIIGRSMLGYSDAQARQFTNQTDFDNDYFNPSAVTADMEEIGIQSLKYIKLAYQRIGKMWSTPDDTTLATATKMAPLACGIPVFVPNYNQVNVPSYVAGTMQHLVTMYVASQGQTAYSMLDNYNPYKKSFEKPYSLNSVVQPFVSAIPQVAPVAAPKLTIWERVWKAVYDYLARMGLITSLGKLSTGQLTPTLS